MIYGIYLVDSVGFLECSWLKIGKQTEQRGLRLFRFHERCDAVRAMEKLDKKGYDNLIIRVEFAGKMRVAVVAGRRYQIVLYEKLSTNDDLS